jgi:hypothetical protein
MRLNYRPQIKANTANTKNDTLRSETKLSMQSLVSQALASKMPSAPVSPVVEPASNTGWGKSNWHKLIK